MSYKKFIVRPLLGEPGPWVHYKSQPNAKTPRKKSTNSKNWTKIVLGYVSFILTFFNKVY